MYVPHISGLSSTGASLLGRVTRSLDWRLARISHGRSFREYVLGAMIVPSFMCFVWFTFVGGTAIDLTLNGDEGDAITSVGISSQLFAMINHSCPLLLHQ